MMDEFKEGQYIIYKNGNSYEIGKIKRVVNDGAFVFYSGGDTASKTPFSCMHEIINDYAIGETNLGGRTTPVRHGHWNAWKGLHWTRKHGDNGDKIYKEHTYYQCSECRRRTVIKSAYCPACGCRMDDELPY